MRSLVACAAELFHPNGSLTLYPCTYHSSVGINLYFGVIAVGGGGGGGGGVNTIAG